MPEIGRSVSHYRILDKLGSGGMGEVYRAQDTKPNRQVAVKVLPEVFSGNPEQLAHFEREALLDAYSAEPKSSPLRSRVAGQIATLKSSDRRWSVDSVPTASAVYRGQELWRMVGADPEAKTLSVYRDVAARSTPAQRLESLAAASDKLTADFGSWRTPWGQINRYQRLSDDIVPQFALDNPSQVKIRIWIWDIVTDRSRRAGCSDNGSAASSQ